MSPALSTSVREAAPAMRGLKPIQIGSPGTRWSTVREAAPAMRGLKLPLCVLVIDRFPFVREAAPAMRGLKLVRPRTTVSRGWKSEKPPRRCGD